MIEKASAGESSGKTHGSISADVSRKNLPSYIQIGDTISDATESKSAQITDIYRDSVITFKVVPDDGYNVKEWIINGHKLTSETENIKLYSYQEKKAALTRLLPCHQNIFLMDAR